MKDDNQPKDVTVNPSTMTFKEFAERAPKEWGIELHNYTGRDYFNLGRYGQYAPWVDDIDNAGFIIMTRDICVKEKDRLAKEWRESRHNSKVVVSGAGAWEVCFDFLNTPFKDISATLCYETLCKLVEVIGE